jgi:hypothetical protein
MGSDQHESFDVPAVHAQQYGDHQEGCSDMRAMGSAPASRSAALSLEVAVALSSLGLLLVPLSEPAGSVGSQGICCPGMVQAETVWS